MPGLSSGIKDLWRIVTYSTLSGGDRCRGLLPQQISAVIAGPVSSGHDREGGRLYTCKITSFFNFHLCLILPLHFFYLLFLYSLFFSYIYLLSIIFLVFIPLLFSFLLFFTLFPVLLFLVEYIPGDFISCILYYILSSLFGGINYILYTPSFFCRGVILYIPFIIPEYFQFFRKEIL
jgi:hypothetical protein